MIYTKLTKKALRIAFDIHKDQVDKAGLPYIFHPYHLAEQMSSEDEICVALLHDVVEDSGTSLDKLRGSGFGFRVMNALSALTRDAHTDYFDYIRSIAANPLAAKIKLADLRHNSDMARLDTADESARQRLEKYREAIRLLSSAEQTGSYSPGKLGDIKYFAVESDGIIKVVDGVRFFSLNGDGEFVPDQFARSIFVDGMKDFEPISEKSALKEASFRKGLR